MESRVGLPVNPVHRNIMVAGLFDGFFFILFGRKNESVFNNPRSFVVVIHNKMCFAEFFISNGFFSSTSTGTAHPNFDKSMFRQARHANGFSKFSAALICRLLRFRRGPTVRPL